MRASLRVVMTLTAGAVLAAPVPVAAAQAAAATRPAAPARPPAWRVVRVPRSVVSPSELDDVSASGPADAWAVGAEAETGFEQGRPMILHWNGRRWATVKLRSHIDLGASSISPGSSGRPQWAGLEDFAGGRTAYAHYNGTAWSNVPGATVLPGNAFDAFTVTAHIPGTDATWGVGGSADDTGVPIRAIIEFNPGTPPA